jgi:hypothetical protein
MPSSNNPASEAQVRSIIEGWANTVRTTTGAAAFNLKP